MRTIFVTASLPMMIRNLVRTGVLDLVAKQYNVVLLAPFAEDPAFVEEFRHKNFVVEKLHFEESRKALLGRFLFGNASQRRFLRTHKLDIFFFKEEAFRRSRLFHYLVRSLIDWMNRGRLVESVGRLVLQNSWNRSDAHRRIFDKYKPVSIVSTHPYLPTEWPLIWHAQRRGLPIVGLMHSWDNVFSRGELPFRFDRFFVWSELLKRKLLKFHPWMQQEEVCVCGAPQYDLFVNETQVDPREEFFAQRGLDPERQLVTLAGAGGAWFPDEMEAARLILEANRSGLLDRPIQLWIRPYGGKEIKLPPLLAQYEQDVIWEQAPLEFWGTFRREEHWKGADKGLHDYINLLYHSDVVISSVSTVSLDAAVLDKPIINVGFDVRGPKYFTHSIRRWQFGSSHYQLVVRTGGVRLAMDPEELIIYLNEYLKDPSLDQETRRRLVAEICGPVDGQSRQRLASAIVESVRRLSSEND